MGKKFKVKGGTVVLTLLVQAFIDVDDIDTFNEDGVCPEIDEIVGEIEGQGWSVSIENAEEAA